MPAIKICLGKLSAGRRAVKAAFCATGPMANQYRVISDCDSVKRRRRHRKRRARLVINIILTILGIALLALWRIIF
jgi:hypothetical protein